MSALLAAGNDAPLNSVAGTEVIGSARSPSPQPSPIKGEGATPPLPHRGGGVGGEGEFRTLCALEDIPRLGSRVVQSAAGDIAVFRTADDAVFALHDKCPHKGGPLSQGIVHGRQVACPLHGWKIGLEDGQAATPDIGCTKSFAVKVEDGLVLLKV